jgi:exosome complex component RRP43
LVRTGDTTVICGVRAETILTNQIPSYRSSNTETELADYDLVVPNIELATGCAPQFLPGGPPTTLAQTLSTRIYSLLHSSKLIQPRDLRIWHTRPTEELAEEQDAEGMAEDEGDDTDGSAESEKFVVAYWVLYIDMFFISFYGNPFDAAWAAAVAALRNTKLPRARYDHDREVIVCSKKDPVPLSITGTPIALTAVVFTGRETDQQPGIGDGRFWLLLDPDSLEESLCSEGMTVVVDCEGGEIKILSLSKHGGTVLSGKLLRSKALVERARSRWEQFVKAIGPTV